MQLNAVPLARVLCFFELASLDLSGKLFFRGLVDEVTTKFSFQTSPDRDKPFDFSKGVDFFSGYYDGTNVLKISFFNDGVVLDTSATTDESKRLILGFLDWLRDSCGASYSPDKIARWGYLSNLSFSSEAELTTLNPVLDHACERLEGLAESLGREPFQYKATRIAFDFDHAANNVTRSPFTIERLAIAHFNENKYFSAAPLPTDLHIQLLEEIEAGILGAHTDENRKGKIRRTSTANA